MKKAAVVTTVFLVAFLVGGVALATAGPEVDDASGTWTMTASSLTQTTCTGEDGASYETDIVGYSGPVTGTTSGDFGLSGSLSMTATSVINTTTGDESVVWAPITLIQDATHRFKGKLQGTGISTFGTELGRGFITGTEQKKTSTGFVNTADHLWANVEFQLTFSTAGIAFGESQGPDPSTDGLGLRAIETTLKTC